VALNVIVKVLGIFCFCVVNWTGYRSVLSDCTIFQCFYTLWSVIKYRKLWKHASWQWHIVTHFARTLS